MRVARIAPLAVLLIVLMCGPVHAAAPPRLLFGLNDAPLFHPDPERALDLHAGVGATVQRLGVQWRNVQPDPGVWDWGYPDQAIGAAASRGMEVIAVISTPAPWASNQYVPGAVRFQSERRVLPPGAGARAPG